MKTNYILITPAHNEKEHIELVIKSVISQTILPKRWIIVDDGSTDGTTQIIRKYAAQHDFLICHRLERANIETYYAHKTQVFLAGYEDIKSLEYDFIGNLDADINFEPTYYESILQEFDKNLRLGIASGIYIDKIGNKFQKVPIDMNHCPGAIQILRRECYEEIGGYIPLKYGGDDSCAEIMARMNGWQTKSFSEYVTIHHRPVGTSDGNSILRARFQQGLTEYSVATHPLFMVAKSFRRVFLEKPYFLASAARLIGYFYAHLRRDERCIPDEVVKFLRKEQLSRLRAYLSRSYPRSS